MKQYNKMSFKGGYVDGSVYDAKQVEALADIPSREELIARFMGSIQSPLSQLVRTFKQSLMRVQFQQERLLRHKLLVANIF